MTQREVRVGRGFKIKGVISPLDKIQYDVVLFEGENPAVVLSHGCVGLKSLAYWFNSNVVQMRRLMCILDTIDLYRTYGKKEDLNSDSMDEEMLMDWAKDLIGYYGEESNQYKFLTSRFQDYIKIYRKQ